MSIGPQSLNEINVDLEVFQKILRLFKLLDLSLKEDKCRFWCFRRFKDFHLFGISHLREMQILLGGTIDMLNFSWRLRPLPPLMRNNADLDVWDFKIFNFSGPPKNEQNADLDVSEEFRIFNFPDTLCLKWRKNANFDVSEEFKIFKCFRSPNPSMRKLQIGMFQKISIFSTILDPLPLMKRKDADLDISEDFQILHLFGIPQKW